MKRSRLVRHARLERSRFRVRSRGATEKRATGTPLRPMPDPILADALAAVGAWVCPVCGRVYPYGDPGAVTWPDCCQRCGSPDFVRAERARRSAAKPHPKRTRLKPMSAKRKTLLPERTALLLGLKELVGWACEFCRDPKCWPLDGHEVRKPRSQYWLNPEYVVILGRPHHDMAEAAYGSKTGRLETPGTRSQGWGFRHVRAASKFAGRAG